MPHRKVNTVPDLAAQVEGDFHYDSRKAQLLWSIELVDDTNRTGQLEFSLPGSYPEDAFFPVDVSFSAQHTLADVSIAQARLRNPAPSTLDPLFCSWRDCKAKLRQKLSSQARTMCGCILICACGHTPSACA